jgi:UPF0271 protein
MISLLDAAAVLNDAGFSFSNKEEFLTTPAIVDELRDIRSRHLADNALQEGLLKLREPRQDSIERVKAAAKEQGFNRLSIPDISLLALALDLKRENKAFVLITDDYSVQNFCSVFGIKFDSVLRGKIEKTISFKKKCIGCKREFPGTFVGRSCPDCGSAIKKEPIS